MQKKIVIGCLALLSILTAYHLFQAKIVVHGSHIIIDHGAHHIEGILEPESTQQCILKDMGISINTFSGDAFVTMLPLDSAEQLRAQYGNFFKCDSPGAAPSMQRMQLTVMIAGNKRVKNEIAQAVALVKQSHIPVVNITGSKIQITKHTYFKMNVEDNTGTLLYYVNSLNVLRQDYL